MRAWLRLLIVLVLLLSAATFPQGVAMAATETILIASFDNGNAQLSLRFDTTSRQIDAAICDVVAGHMDVTLTKRNGQTRSFGCDVGQTLITNIPGNLQMEIEAESGLWTTTSQGNDLIMQASYSPAQ